MMVLVYVEIAHMMANLIVIALDKFEFRKILPGYFKLHQVYLAESEDFIYHHLPGNPYNFLYLLLKNYYNIGDRAIP